MSSTIQPKGGSARESSAEGRSYSAPAAACAGEVLLLLSRSAHPMSLAEIERGLPRTKSLVFRVVRELESQRLLEREGDGRYRLGIASFELGAGYLSQAQFLDVVRQVLQQLARDAGETVNLGVLSGMEALYILKYLGQSAWVTITNVGGRVPANCVAIGKALLAELDDDELTSVVQRGPLVRMTPRSLTDPADLMSDIDKTRERGFALDEQEAVLGRCGLAVAVRLTGGSHDFAAVSLSTNAESWEDSRPRLRQLLLEAKGRINREVSARQRNGEISASL